MSSNASSFRRKSDCGDSRNRVFDPVQVFCRVRPLQGVGDISNVDIKNLTTVVLVSPNNTISQKQYLDHETHYMFKQVFGSMSTQNEVYKVVAQPLVEKLIRGSSSLLFTYGVTGSGKTYTMTGDFKELGLMPRCLEALFRSIGGFHARKCTFQPDHLNGFEIVSDVEAVAKQKLEKHQRTLVGQRMVPRELKCIELEFDLETLKDVAPLPGVDERNVYAVFISYTEVYNNCVYDLLEECSVQRSLQSRIVREDSNHNMYVNGVTEIEIKSVQEAMEAFQIGQKHKRIGHTVLNAESSRSHSIFNIRLVQAPTGQHVLKDKDFIKISQLSLVDLAGSERSSRTNNTGARLREAGNINNSLMTLRSCLEYLRENQQAPPGGNTKKIPYRDSKITQLFKNFFEGEGQVSMIVCINPRLEDYSENSQVMKFAEMTQEVQIPRATTVQLCNNESEIMNMLRTRFFGFDFEVPSGDGPLSEKLIFMFQQYLMKSKKSTNALEEQCEKYQERVSELEKQNLDLNIKLSEERIVNKRILGRNQLLEKAVNSHRESLSLLQQQLKNQTDRLESIEEDLKRIQLSNEPFKIFGKKNDPSLSGTMNLVKEFVRNKEKKIQSITLSNEVYQNRAETVINSSTEILTSTPNVAPSTIDFKLIKNFIDSTERDEI